MDRLSMVKWIDESRKDGVSELTFQRDGDKKFVMSFEGNLDLYFSLNNFFDDPTFIIGKDNYTIYEIFDDLYQNVIRGVYDESAPHDSWMTDEELFELFEITGYDRIDEAERRKREQNRSLELAQRTGLIQDGEIIWRSDDFPIDSAPYFKISKYPNAYMITFGIPMMIRKPEDLEELKKGWAHSVSVRICNSGSRYDKFHLPFMKAYNTLLSLPVDYEQIHIEEFMVEEKAKQEGGLEKVLVKK